MEKGAAEAAIPLQVEIVYGDAADEILELVCGAEQIRAVLANGRRAVAALDALVAHTIVGDEALEREWRSAKRVQSRAAAVEEEQAPEVAGAITPSTIKPSVIAPLGTEREVAAAA